MRFTLILENETGEQINMTTTANQYMTSEIDGLYPPVGTISTSTYAGMDGSYLNNAFIEKRNLVISFQMRGVGIENRRHTLYRVVKPSRYIKIYYSTANIDVYTEGYVETCEISNFSNLTSGQISIICPDIYWYSTSAVYAYYSQITGAFHFPFPENDKPFVLGTYSKTDNISIENHGDVTGFTIQIEAVANAMTPTIYNADTGDPKRRGLQYYQPSCFGFDLAEFVTGCEHLSSDGSSKYEKSPCDADSHGRLSGGVKCRLKFMICRQTTVIFLSLWRLFAIVSAVFYGTWNITSADSLKYILLQIHAI